MTNNSTLVLTTGAPGSMWSMISLRLKKATGYFDATDEIPERSYEIPDYHKPRLNIQHKRWKGRTHIGSYFGPYHEFGGGFDDIEKNYTRDEFFTECLKPFSGAEQYKLIRSHWFAYNLDWIWENCKGHKLFLIWREAQAAKDWWYGMGGWNISYPSYTWYENDERMWTQIQKESKLVLDFAKSKNIELFDYYPNWMVDKIPNAATIDLRTDPVITDTIKIAYVDIPN